MKEIVMIYDGKPCLFQITYECLAYFFCECENDPGKRGFFTRGFYYRNAVGIYDQTWYGIKQTDLKK
jgi:hypothetical protein